MFIEIFFICIEDINEIPLVISKKPIIKGDIKSLGKLKILKVGSKSLEQIFNIWLVLKIEIITEKRTIKPPIIKIVDVAFAILSDKIAPKSENNILLLDESWEELFVTELL